MRTSPLAIAMMIFAIAPFLTCSQTLKANSRDAGSPTFYRDVQPILQRHCQSCHRPGEIAPMPLMSYKETKPFALAIASDVGDREMPPWFADRQFGHFSNDPSLSSDEVRTLVDWAAAKAPAGKPEDAPPAKQFVQGWNIPQPDLVIRMPKVVSIPALCGGEYTYEIVPTDFNEDKWVRISEIRPSSRANVHHAVVYIRPPDSPWLRHAPIGVPFTTSDMKTEQDRRDTRTTKADILLVYAPGSSPDTWPEGMAKFIPAGSDIVFQMHYTSLGRPAMDRTEIGMVFAKQPPKLRVLTLQLTNSSFVIPPGVEQAGTVLQAVAWYDNSTKNPHNPDPSAAVYWGDQTSDEMMVGFFDVAVRADIDKTGFFIRPAHKPQQSEAH